MLVSAKYANPENNQVMATDEKGRIWWVDVQSDAGAWNDYLEKGGTISPYVPTGPVDLPARDIAELNAALLVDGSVMRALGMVMFVEINKLRVKTGDTPYTLNQFKNALIAQMRT